MFIKQVTLKNFRNYKDLHLELSGGLNIFTGNNAQGKTNFLESINLCSTGMTQRTSNEQELILFGEDFAHIRLITAQKDISFLDKIDITLKRPKGKGIAINQQPLKKIGEIFGHLLIVMFSVDDLKIIKYSPSERRRFIDTELCQMSPIYYSLLNDYYKALRHRNICLKKNAVKNLTEAASIWDDILISRGKEIIKARESFISNLNTISKQVHSTLSNNKEDLKIEYKPNVSADGYEQAFANSLTSDQKYQSTQVGIHKDDLIFYINNNNAKHYCSQGQQRTAILSLKLSKIEYSKQYLNKTPILLLDDIMSELDENRQIQLLRYTKDTQTLITCTSINELTKKINNISQIYKVEEGKIYY